MQEIWVVAGGDWYRNVLNAIATFMQTENWRIIERMSVGFSVLIVAGSWIQKHNVMVLLGWAFSLTLVSMLVLIKTPVQVIDYSEPSSVYQVDNVPIGLAIPASLTTRIGNALVQSYERVMVLPDSAVYSKTGMLFGSNLVARSTDFTSQDQDVVTLYSDYVQNCVIGDMLLNHKYSFEDLMHSTDPYTLIFADPSPLRGLFDKNNQFKTCQEASVALKSALALDTQNGGKTWNYYVRQLFGGRPNPDVLMSALLGNSYEMFYHSSQSASQIIRQNVTINALKNGIQSYAARSNDPASLINIATTSSLEKQRLAQASMGQQALRTLPMMQTVILGMMIGMFPIIVMAAMFNMLTLQVLKSYVVALMWLQCWPILYAILNSAMTFYAAKNATPVVLSELSQVQLRDSDIATTAGYISLMIPGLAWMMIKNVGAGFSNIYSHFASSGLSSASQAASGVVDGNYSFSNMQTDNVSGNSWNTNSTTAFGQMTRQLDNGGTGTQTRDGTMVWDTSTATSKLPIDVNVNRQIASMQQQMARESEVQAFNALKGYNQSVTSAWNTLKQFGTNTGSSSSWTTGADSTESSQESMVRSKLINAVDAYSKANHISREEAFSQLMDKSIKGSLSGEIYGSARAGAGFEVFGTGAHVEGGGRVSVSGSVSSGSQNNISESQRQADTTRREQSSQAVEDFRESSDYFISRKTSHSGNVTDNTASSRIDQFAASLSSAKSHYAQYTASESRSHEFSEMASHTESQSAQMNESLTQQFANFVRVQAPQNAETVLTNTSSPEIAAQRETLARDFVKTHVEAKIDNVTYESALPASNNRGEIVTTDSRGDPVSDYSQHTADIETMTMHAGIKSDVSKRVAMLISDNNQKHQSSQESLTHQSEKIKGHFSAMGSNHDSSGNQFTERLKKVTEEQKNNSGNQNGNIKKDKK